MWEGIKGFFGYSGIADTALKIVDKLAGTDWTPKEKAEYTLKYMEATKHQSPARRLIAMGILLEHLGLATTWLILTLVGDTETASAVLEFLQGTVNISLDIIIAFYFLSGIAKKQ